ncbi:UrcA family protein [Novosphingobium sp.]|uniref:UrcA family protein n=1 Tax=Novosphingobium sp. TaxID=1874826 RepID=UPI00286E752A|nr:UrcA family protein [Novosphingobium sp.]
MKSIFAPALALAVLAAPFASAMAASPQRNSVQFNDLDLESAAGKKTLDGRIRNAARRACDDVELTGTRLAKSACVADVRRQVIAQVESYQNRVGKGG